jgi:hypothetical protein
MILNECIVGCKNIGGHKVLAKNRDRTYDSDVAIIHYVSKDLEYAIIFDPKTKYMEGLNATSGIAIMNVALMNGTDFAAAESKEGLHIMNALLKAKTPLEAAQLLSKEALRVYGSTIIADASQVLVLENVPDMKPKCVQRDVTKYPVVRTNHSVEIPNVGYTANDGDDYISSMTRQAVGEVIFADAESAEGVLDALNYSVFGNHSSYDATRDTSGMRTCSQMAIDIEDKAIYFRTIPGHGKLRGVHRIGNQNLEPEIKIKILDYNEPTHVPFESWGTSMMNLPENFDLAKLLDPEDEYSDTSALSDTEAAAIEDRTDDQNVQHYIDRENEIIGMLVSLQNLMKNDDGGMMHLMKDRDFEEDASQIDGMLVDAEKSTMDLYNLKSANRARVQEQALRSKIREILKTIR